MIISTHALVCVSGRNKPYYESLGYVIPTKSDNKNRKTTKKGTQIYVLVKDLPKYSQALVEYKCDDCGKVKKVHYQTICGRKNSQYNKTKETLCSDCANHRMSGKANSNYKHGSKRFPEYRNNAKRRGISFCLTPEQFEDIIRRPCFYCGGFSSDRFSKSRGNGIDRVDSSKGYVLDNCVPCCSTCNFIKNNMPYKEFVSYITKIYQRIVKNEI